MNEGNNEEKKGLFKNQSKLTFWLGLFIGISAISTFAFFFTLAIALDNGSLGKSNANSEDNGDVAGADNTVNTNTNQAVDDQKAKVNIDQVVTIDENSHIRGNENAAVTLIEFSDYECSYCARHEDTIAQILEAYPDDVRLIYKHFPLSFHTNAQKAAEASECAAEQGKFWEMHDKIFEANTNGDMSVDKWKEVAKDLGLNTTQFNSCLDDGKYADQVKADQQEGLAAGVEGTPATYVNGTLISGAYPYDSFKSIIDAELGK